MLSQEAANWMIAQKKPNRVSGLYCQYQFNVVNSGFCESGGILYLKKPA